MKSLVRFASKGRGTRAFTLIELLVVIAVIALLIGILLPALAEARRTGKITICQSNLHQFGVSLSTYSSEFKDMMPTFSWKQKASYQKDFSDLDNAADDVQAAANQAVYIIRKRADYPTFPKITGWIPHFFYTHLVTLDYRDVKLPDKSVACPEDKYRIGWQERPKDDPKTWYPPPPDTTSLGKRWAFSSSYLTIPALYDASPVQTRLYQTTWDSVWTSGAASQLRQQKLSDVAFPAAKVYMFEQSWRHVAKNHQYWNYDDVRSHVVMFDASVTNRRTGDSNPGWQPRMPTDKNPTLLSYDQGVNGYTPPARTQPGGDMVTGRWMWTRGGLKGLDFSRNPGVTGEINTGQPGK